MTAGIVARWEWRTFGDRFGAADATLDARTPERVQESDEQYLLSVAGDSSVKVRDDLMDVKHLQQVNDDGLELWLPVMKAGFPLSRADVESVVTTLGVAVPSPGRDAYSLAQLAEEIVAPSFELLLLPVHKHRAHHTIDDCMVERTEVRTERGTTRTIAIESPDPARVIACIATLGLAGRRNVNVARGLATLAGFGARRYAVVDVGTNSVKFHVGERQADREWRTVVDRADVTRLGEGLDESGRLAEAAIARTVGAIAGMVDEARRDDVVEIAAVGTAGLRSATNRDAFIEAVQARCGITVEVISGEEEARLAYVAATATLPVGRGRLVVFDSGGGSSQFTFGRDGDVDERFSVDVGAVRCAERYGLTGVVTDDALAAALDGIAHELDRLDGHDHLDAVIGIGGTVTNLAAVKHALARYDPDVVQGTLLDRAEIDRQIEQYRSRTPDQRRGIVGLQPNRAEVILAGACIVRTILTKLGHDALTVSDRGLRHGLLRERFDR
jgi:exopolyphosphatase / guanosine-5'-triphosphate,3'-diphosphate pyrophosphatase